MIQAIEDGKLEVGRCDRRPTSLHCVPLTMEASVLYPCLHDGLIGLGWAFDLIFGT